MIQFAMKHPRANVAMLGYIPSFFNEGDKRSAKEQVDINYAHGGGWSRFVGFIMKGDALHYPPDPPRVLLAEGKLHDETIRVYDGAWVAIVQSDGTYEISRMD